MKKYFLNRIKKPSMLDVPVSVFEAYRENLLCELQKMGATESELNLVCEDLILNSIISESRPEDVAWAILQ